MSKGGSDANPRIDVLFSAAEIGDRLGALAREIVADFGTDFLIVPVLKGSFIFAADLVRALHFAGANPRVDFLSLASYGAATSSSGKVEVLRDLEADVGGDKVLLIDDILESGRTLEFATGLLTSRGAAKTAACVLLDKPGKRAVSFNADYVGFECPDRFVIGYGMDLAHAYRALPYIGYLPDA